MKAINSLKPAMVLALLALSLATVQGQLTVTNRFGNINKVIPDGSAMGVTDTRKVETPGIAFVTDLQVQLTIEGGLNGDLYCYLVHDSGFVVLVNRPGRSAANSIGYEDSGFSATFSAQATNDFHFYRQTGCASDNGSFDMVIAGVCAPDGRETDPRDAVDNAPRKNGLASFGGLNPNGNWTLFLADLSSGEQAKLKDWGLVITGTAEPAPDLRLAKGPPYYGPASIGSSALLAHSTINLLP